MIPENLNVMFMFTTIAVALITAIFGPMIVSWFKLKLENKKKINPISEAIEINTLIEEQLDDIMEEISCNRTWIAQFHNGGHFYPTGKCIQKFSIFYEKLSPESIPIINIYQNIPVSFFSKALSEVYENGELRIFSFDEGNETYNMENFTSRVLNTKSFYLLAIDDLEGKFIGVLSISFDRKEHILTEKEWIYLRHKVGIIGALLSKYLKVKK